MRRARRKHGNFLRPLGGVHFCAESPLQSGSRDYARQIFRRPIFPSRLVIPDSGNPVIARSQGQVVSARSTPGKIPPLVPNEADIPLATADGNPSPPTPADMTRLCLLVEPQRYPIAPSISPRRTIVPRRLPVVRVCAQNPTAPCCRPSCMLEGTYPCP